MTKLTCLACPCPRNTGQYTCRTCWTLLSHTTRSRLNRRDSKAFARLRELESKIRSGIPLAEIEVSP
ncbi:hypothetical protein [Streptomyces sp. DSM 40484]|uniref:hypothetical protein n=1 Tax=Streptomyces kroppenstedtii TaxID=3051181 RepID=UPI0028D42355|nr:hypothetical protein [Streptomyces sp. DSM 40484]